MGISAHALHQIFEGLALTIGFQTYRLTKSSRPDPIAQDARFWIIVAATFGAAVGSHATALIEAVLPQSQSGTCASGRSIVGALVIGLFAVEGTKKILGVGRSSGDPFVFPTILGLIVGRIGCFVGGIDDCTFGSATTLPIIGVDFGDGVARHPAQLYEIAFLAALWAILAQRAPRLAEGARFKAFLIAYLSFRLVADAWKPLPLLAGSGLAATQIVCLAGLAWYLLLLLSPHAIAKKRERSCPHAITSTTTPR